jgi:hypothetical protein
MNASHLTYLAAQRHPVASDYEQHRQQLVAEQRRGKRRRITALGTFYGALAPLRMICTRPRRKHAIPC